MSQGAPLPSRRILRSSIQPRAPKATTWQKQLTVFSREKEKGNRNLNQNPDCPLPATGSIQVSPSQRKLLELLIGRRRYYANQGAGLAYKGPRGSVPCRPVPTDTEEDASESVMPNKEKDMSEAVMATDKEKDASEPARCGRKPPLWLVLLLAGAAGLLAPLVYFAVRANSEACLDGLRAQTECQGLNQQLQRQLHQTQEVFHEKVAEAATCNQTVVSHCTSSRGPRTWRSLPGSLWRWRQTLKLCPFVTTRVWEPPNSLGCWCV